MGKGVTNQMNKFESPSPKEAKIVPCLAEIGQVALKKKMKMWKVYDANNKTMTLRTVD